MLATSVLAREVDKQATEPAGQYGGRTGRAPIPGLGQISDKVLAITVFVTVVFFAPMSFTYFFDESRTSNLQDKILAVLASPEFAYGKESGQQDADGQVWVLVRNLYAMLPHTMSGAVAIVLGLAQFNRTFQFKYPVIHRNIGRLYGLCAMTICWSSTSFLIDTIPKHDVFSGEYFALILSLLTVSVFLTMVLAVFAIWNGDIGSHREFMTLNYSLMLSAPMLRICWIVLARTWGETKWVINLYSSIFTGPFLIGTSIFYLRQHHTRPTNVTLTSPKFHLAVIGAGVAGLLFLAPRLSRFDQWSYRPTASFWAVVPQWTFQAVSFTVLAERAKHRNDQRAYTAWKTYQNGIISGPAFAVSTYYVCRDVLHVPDEIMGLCTFNGGWLTGLFASFLLYVLFTSTFANPNNRTVKAR
ncbi:hypothetical protein ANI_1_1908144 [Paecilomyces variotii No. 5]|uniref:DUF2306 domain-containing protein n=1 Tax=Byssochlamys spectabilis (strain No. 5 / NBRC 109023) TaxID=1356009 RepID=V5GFG6_BYSSN|nr:hypothetical protein ANI_1_1908144 [Paecilomyces variotii No. 5]